MRLCEERLTLGECAFFSQKERICTWNHGARGGDRAVTVAKRYESSMRRREPPAMGRTLPTLKRAWPKDGPLAAICVQNVDVQCVLQFTLIHAAGCVLHRRTSRVIHRLKLFSFLQSTSSDERPPAKAAGSTRFALRFGSTTSEFCER